MPSSNNSTDYAYYSFPVTPTRASFNTRPSPRSKEVMASQATQNHPAKDKSASSPATGSRKSTSATPQSQAPKTPTKLSQRPEVGTPKQSSTMRKAGAPTSTSKPSTGGKPPKLNFAKSPKREESDNDEMSEQRGRGIEMKEEDDVSDDEEPLSKVKSAKDQAQTEELQSAEPEPIGDDDEDEQLEKLKQGAAEDDGEEDEDRNVQPPVQESEGKAEDESKNETTAKAAGATGDTAGKHPGTTKAAGVTDENQKPQVQKPQEPSKKGGRLLSGAQNLVSKAGGLVGKANTGKDVKAPQNVKKGMEKSVSEAPKHDQKAVDNAPEQVQEDVEAPEEADGVTNGAEHVADGVEHDAEQQVDGQNGALDIEQESEDDADGQTKAQAHGEVEDQADENIFDEGEARDSAEEDEQDGDQTQEELQQQSAEKIGEQTEGQAEDQPAEQLATQEADKAESEIGQYEGQKATGPLDEVLDLSVLNGLHVHEDGYVYDKHGNVIGQLEEDGGEAEELCALWDDDPNSNKTGPMYPINTDIGEILDEDGDLVGRVCLASQEIKRQLRELKDQGHELPEGAEEYLGQDQEDASDADQEPEEGEEEPTGNLPSLSILEGQQVQADGTIYDDDGNTIGQVVEGDPADLKDATLDDQGQFVDAQGNIVGRAKVHDDVEELVKKGVYEPAQTVAQQEEMAEEMADKTADQPGEAVEIEDQLPGAEALQGRALDVSGEIRDPEGNILGGVQDEELKQKIADGEIDPATLRIDQEGQIKDAEDNVLGNVEVAEAARGMDIPILDYRILDGKKVNAKGKILDEDGETIGELVDGSPEKCKGRKANDKGEVYDKKGKLIGHVRVVPGDAATAATNDLLEELGELGSSPEDAEDATEQPEDIAQETEEAVPGHVDEEAEAAEEQTEEISPETDTAQMDEPELSMLDGLRVSSKGQVLNHDGEPIGELAEGELSQCANKKINSKGEVVDDTGNVVGSVRVLPAAEDLEAEEAPEEDAEAEGDELPPLSTLKGLTVNKMGWIIDDKGVTVGQLTSGDPKKLSKAGVTADAEGQFWDGGKVIGRAQTVAPEKPEEEAPFAGFKGLKVVDNGWVQDESGANVGWLVEGDWKDFLGREVDEDGDVLNKKGMREARAERLAPEDVPEETPDDLSFLEGKTVTKYGLVIDDQGVPIARLIKGNAKQLAGKPLDNQGQIWDNKGSVIGQVELIPEDEREQKPEGQFAGYEGLHVIAGGKVADKNENVVGEIVETNLSIQRLVGMTVDEDGDVLNKNGTVLGRAEPIAEEDAIDFSILDGLTLNKKGKVVDAQGKPVGQLVHGNADELQGRQCDAQGLVYNERGGIIGRCEPLPESERFARPAGPFAGMEGLRVMEKGDIKDMDGRVVGKLVSGDAKKLHKHEVDEDGDITDKNGNVIGHAEPTEEEEKAPIDNSILAGKTVNKKGFVLNEYGDPIGLLVYGNAKELANRKCDENGNIYGDTGKVVGRCEVLPDEESVARPQGAFAGRTDLRVAEGGNVVDSHDRVVGQLTEGNWKQLLDMPVDEDGEITNDRGAVLGRATPWSEEEAEPVDLSRLAGTTINKAGNAVDGSGKVIGRVVEGDLASMIKKSVDAKGQVWEGGKVIGRVDLVDSAMKDDGPFAGFQGLQINKDQTITTPAKEIVGRVIEGDIQKLLGHTVDEDGEILDSRGNVIGRAERWQSEEKEHRRNPMAGMHVNKEGEVRDPETGDVIGRLTAGDLGFCVRQEIDEDGNVVDTKGNKIGEVTLLENIVEDEYEGPIEEELAEAAKRQEECETAEKMFHICQQTLERVEPICKKICEYLEQADRTPRDELDEEQLVDNVRPLIEEAGSILEECNGALRALDPDGSIAARAKGRAGAGEATPEEYRLAECLKELTSVVVKCIDDAKKKLADMPHARKKLNPLWVLMSQPLFQILAAVGLLLAGVLGLVGQLLNGLGLGFLVNGILGGLGINKLLRSFGLLDEKKTKRGSNKSALASLPVVGGLLRGNKD